jgi:hypothetical protein
VFREDRMGWETLYCPNCPYRCYRVPLMAAGITDHVWTTQELLLYRAPDTFVDRLHAFDDVFQPIQATHHGS